MASTDSSFNANQTTVEQGVEIIFTPSTLLNLTYSWLIRDNVLGGAYTEFSTEANPTLSTDEVPVGVYDIKLISTTVEFGEGSTEKLAYIEVTEPAPEPDPDPIVISNVENSDEALIENIAEMKEGGYNLLQMLNVGNGYKLIWILLEG
jgi:hypothetical protein